MSAFERIFLHMTTVAAAATGAVFLWMKYILKPSDPFSVVHHPWQPHVLALHVLAVPLLVFALGLIARNHVMERFLDRRPHPSRRTGVAAALVSVPMIVSGYVMQVLTGPAPRKALAVVHAVAGSVFALLYLIHLLRSGLPGRESGIRVGRHPPRRNRVTGRLRLDWLRGLGLESSSRSTVRSPAEDPPAGPERRRS